MKTGYILGATCALSMIAFAASAQQAESTTEDLNARQLKAQEEVTIDLAPQGTYTYRQQGQTYSGNIGVYTYRRDGEQRFYPSTRAPSSSTITNYAEGRYSAPQSEGKLKDISEGITFDGPAYQYEGKWMVTRQSGTTGAALETLASCANPVVLTADSATRLNVKGGGKIDVIPVDTQTFAWNENGRTRMATESTQGNFLTLEETSVYGRNEGGQQILSYMRCGTAGATAAQQMCIAE